MHRSSDNGSTYHYRLFGLDVRSDLELPELWPTDPGEKPDVRISVGDGAPDDGTLLAIDDVAHFYVHGGSHIRVVPKPGVPSRNVRLYLLGSAMGMLLHQRGLLPLHANAVEIYGKAVAFMGPSGAGKSTLAAWFLDRGSRVIADDVCLVRFDAHDTPVVSPGLPRMRLWKDVVEASGRDSAQFDRSYVGDDGWNKFDVPIDRERAPPVATELAAIYLLAQGAEPGVTPLEGVLAAEALYANTYRGQFVPTVGNAQTHWDSCLKLVRRTPIFCAVRSWDLGSFEEQSLRILDHARLHVGTTAS